VHVFQLKNVTFEARWRRNEFGEGIIFLVEIGRGRYFVQIYYLSDLLSLTRPFDQTSLKVAISSSCVPPFAAKLS